MVHRLNDFSVERRSFVVGAAGLLVAGATQARSPVDVDRVRQLAKDAYIWGYPMVDMYNILHGQVLDRQSPEFKADLNQVGHVRNVATPKDTVVIAPNVDTPYSYIWMDLRAEPVVVTLPAFEPERYMSLQLFDLYTWIIDYVTPRTNGHVGGDFMVVPPGWKGHVPGGVKKVFESTTLLTLGFLRTQLLGPGDLSRVHALQDAVQVRPLSAYLGRSPLKPKALPKKVPPVNLRREPMSAGFMPSLAWMMQFMPALPDEQKMRNEWVALGLTPGRYTPPADASARQAMAEGFGLALQAMGERAKRVQSSAELFGSRAFLGQDYLVRAVGALLGILGNAAEEYLGVGYQTDAAGLAFDGAKRYSIRFAPHALPPVDAFWSITVYNQQRLLYENEIQRYVINSPMLGSLARDADGGFTLYLQNQAPEGDAARNWLPVPAGPFGLTFRTYLPRADIRDGRWRAPPVQPISG